MSHSFGSLDRREAVKALLADRKDLLVVTGLGSPNRQVAVLLSQRMLGKKKWMEPT